MLQRVKLSATKSLLNKSSASSFLQWSRCSEQSPLAPPVIHHCPSVCQRSAAGQRMMAQLHGLHWKRISFKKSFTPLRRIHLKLLITSRFYIYLTTYWHSGYMEKNGKIQSDDTLEHSTLRLFWRDSFSKHGEPLVNFKLLLQELGQAGLHEGSGHTMWTWGHPPRLIRATTEQSYCFPSTKCRQLLLAFPCMFYFK